MADESPKVRAYDRLGNKVMVPKDQVGQLYALGGRVATRQEQDEHELQEKYDKASTLSKVAGAVTGIGARNPTLEAWHRGGVSGLTAGLGNLAIKEGAEAIMPGAGKAYAEETDKLRAASPLAYQGGEVAGMIGGAAIGSAAGIGPAGAVTKAIPSAGIAALGGAAEAGVGEALGGLAARGALARAGVEAAKLGARGAAEGALYSAAQEASDQLLHDQELSTDKIIAQTGHGALWGGLGGAVLGGAGSLAKSGLGAAARGLGELSIDAPGISGAARQKANALAFDALGATKQQAVNALEHVKGGSDAVGEYVNRVAIKPATDEAGFIGGTFKAGMNGRADNLLELIQADKSGRIAEGLSNSIKGTPARVSMSDLASHGDDIYQSMLKDPTKIAGADAFRNRISLEASAVQNAGKVAADGTIDAADAFYLRSDMAKQAYELGRASGAAGDAYKQYLKAWDNASIQALDEAAAKAGKSGIADDIRYWKREWQLASAAEELAQHGSDRVNLNNIIGLRAGVGAAVGFATGHPLTAAASGLGLKLLQERGPAAGAYALGKIADSQLLTKLVARTNNQIAAASRGPLTAPAKRPLPEMPVGKPRARAEYAMKAIAALQADPEGTTARIAKQTEGIEGTSPELAQSIAQRHAQSLSFLASKMPTAPDRDPLDPHPAPRMTDAEAATFARYVWYTEKPSRFFEELAHGKLTPEGAETAQALMPRAFAELQERMLDAIATHMSRGRSIPFQQRLKIGSILDIPAVPAQRPEHMLMLQQNVLPSPGDLQSKPAPSRRSATIPTQRSALDRLESSGPGR